MLHKTRFIRVTDNGKSIEDTSLHVWNDAMGFLQSAIDPNQLKSHAVVVYPNEVGQYLYELTIRYDDGRKR